jgi:biotin operon repressor
MSEVFMNAARYANSDRLQRAVRYLSDGKWHSTMDIIKAANICAVNSVMSELRENGFSIQSECNARVWYYRLAGQARAA